MTTLYTYGTIENVELKAEFKPAKNVASGKTLIYIHGGGFVLGKRNDLPQTYIDMLNDAGHHLLLLDYPLAPEVDLTVIKEYLVKAIEWFQANYQIALGLQSPDYYLFGRSAGAYLSLLLSVKAPSPHQKGIIAFYGYYSLLLEALQKPNKSYLQFPRSSFMDLYELTEGGIKASASIKERYPLYINYRQTGDWLNKILPNRALWESYSLTDIDLYRLPRTFITASDTDKDVPYECSLHLSQAISNSYFHPVTGQYHDYDRDPNNPLAIETYQTLIEWLNKA